MSIVVLVVINIGFAHFRPLNVVLILMTAFKMDFTTWSNCTAVEIGLIWKGIFGLVVNHIVFAHIRPQNVEFIVLSAFKVSPGRIPSGWKDHIWFSGKSYRVRPYPTIKKVHFPLIPHMFIFSDGFYRLVGFLTAVETHLIWKTRVDFIRTHTEFAHILQ